MPVFPSCENEPAPIIWHYLPTTPPRKNLYNLKASSCIAQPAAKFPDTRIVSISGAPPHGSRGNRYGRVHVPRYFPRLPSLAGLFDPRVLFSGVEGRYTRTQGFAAHHQNGLPLGAFLRVHASICGERIGDLLRITVFCLGLSLVGGLPFYFFRVSGGDFLFFSRARAWSEKGVGSCEMMMLRKSEARWSCICKMDGRCSVRCRSLGWGSILVSFD